MLLSYLAKELNVNTNDRLQNQRAHRIRTTSALSRKRDSFTITFGGGSVGGEGIANRRSDLATPRFSSVAYEQKSPVHIYAVIHEKHTAAHHHAKKSVKIIQFKLFTASALTTSWSALDFIPIIITEQVKKSDAEGVKHVINISPVVLMLPKRQSFKQNKWEKKSGGGGRRVVSSRIITDVSFLQYMAKIRI